MTLVEPAEVGDSEIPRVNTIYDALVYQLGDPKQIPWDASDFHWPLEEEEVT